MSVESIALAALSISGRLQGVIKGILHWDSEEISPSVKKTLEEALKWAEEEWENAKKDSIL